MTTVDKTFFKSFAALLLLGDCTLAACSTVMVGFASGSVARSIDVTRCTCYVKIVILLLKMALRYHPDKNQNTPEATEKVSHKT